MFVREAKSVRVVWMDFSSALVHASEEVMAMEWDAFVAKLEFNMVIHRSASSESSSQFSN